MEALIVQRLKSRALTPIVIGWNEVAAWHLISSEYSTIVEGRESAGGATLEVACSQIHTYLALS